MAKQPSDGFKINFNEDRPDVFYQGNAMPGASGGKRGGGTGLLYLLCLALLIGVSYLLYKDITASRGAAAGKPENEVRDLIDDRFSSLSVKQAKLEESIGNLQLAANESAGFLEEKISEAEKKISAFESNLGENLSGKVDMDKLNQLLAHMETQVSDQVLSQREEVRSTLDETLSGMKETEVHLRGQFEEMGKTVSDNVESIINAQEILEVLSEKLYAAEKETNTLKQTVVKYRQAIVGSKTIDNMINQKLNAAKSGFQTDIDHNLASMKRELTEANDQIRQLKQKVRKIDEINDDLLKELFLLKRSVSTPKQ